MLDKALRLHSDALWRHDRACALMEKKGDALIEAGKKHDAVVEAKNEEIASLKERIAELERNRDADRALFERQAEAKVKRSRDALEAMKECKKLRTKIRCVILKISLIHLLIIDQIF